MIHVKHLQRRWLFAVLGVIDLFCRSGAGSL